jgi:hypothetical protein
MTSRFVGKWRLKLGGYVKVLQNVSTVRTRHGCVYFLHDDKWVRMSQGEVT